MSPWRSRTSNGDRDNEQAVRAAGDMVAALDAGRLTSVAAARIADQRAAGMFTSDLSVRELAALRAAGYEAVGQVFGSATIRVNRQQAILQSPRPFALSAGTPWPIRGYFEGELRARQRALRRMQNEARALKSWGVMGVRAVRSARQAGSYEYSVVGTAIAPTRGHQDGTPFLTALDGAELAALSRSGWLPVTVVLSMVRWSANVGGIPGTWLGPSSRVYGAREMSALTALQQRAQSDARAQLQGQALAAGASGVLLHDLTSVWQRDEALFSLEAEVMGTAILQSASPERPASLQVAAVRSFSDDARLVVG